MKIRSDFVTNSSSANYILELSIQTDDDMELVTWMAASPEAAITQDGDICGDDINLSLDDIAPQIKTLLASDKPSMNELIDLICSNIYIDYYQDFSDDDDDNESEDDENDGQKAKASVIFPTTIQDLKNAAKDVDPKHIKTITATHQKDGHGDSAMFIYLNNFDHFVQKYKHSTTDEEKQKVLQETIQYLRNRPLLEVEDNEYCIDGEQPVEFAVSDEVFAQLIKDILQETYKGRNYWMGAWTEQQVLDVTTGETTGETTSEEHFEVNYIV